MEQKKMQYGSIPGVRLPVSRLVFGCAFPEMRGGQEVGDVLDAAFAAGFNTFDTAENYGPSEASLGRWVNSRNVRDQVVVLTKGAHPYDGRSRVTPQDIRADIEKSFDRLGTDYIDIYLLHRDDPEVEVGPLVELLDSYRRAGRIGVYGGSNWTAARVAEANAYAAAHGLFPFAVSSPQFSLAVQVRDPWGGCVSISAPEQRGDRAWYAAQNIPIFSYSSLGSGMLSGRVKSAEPDAAKAKLNPDTVFGYHDPLNFERLARAEQLAQRKGCTVPDIGLAWLLHQELTVYPVVAASKPSHMARNVAAFSVSLTPFERDWLEHGGTLA